MLTSLKNRQYAFFINGEKQRLIEIKWQVGSAWIKNHFQSWLMPVFALQPFRSFKFLEHIDFVIM